MFPSRILGLALTITTAGCLLTSSGQNPMNPDGDGDSDADADVDEDADLCVPSQETCNEQDDDCDGLIDEDFDLQSDLTNCGRCGNSCPSEPDHAAPGCDFSLCVGGATDCGGGVRVCGTECPP